MQRAAAGERVLPRFCERSSGAISARIISGKVMALVVRIVARRF